MHESVRWERVLIKSGPPFHISSGELFFRLLCKDALELFQASRPILTGPFKKLKALLSFLPLRFISTQSQGKCYLKAIPTTKPFYIVCFIIRMVSFLILSTFFLVAQMISTPPPSSPPSPLLCPSETLMSINTVLLFLYIVSRPHHGVVNLLQTAVPARTAAKQRCPARCQGLMEWNRGLMRSNLLPSVYPFTSWNVSVLQTDPCPRGGIPDSGSLVSHP